MTANSVDVTVGAAVIPESTTLPHSTVVIVDAVDKLVIVAVERGEHHSVVVSECIEARVAREP